MVRKILGVLLGYVVLFIGIFILYSAAYFAMGSDTAFKPETYDTTIVWTISAFVLGFIAAVIAGFSAALIGKGNTPKILAIVVLALGIVAAVFGAMEKPTDEKRAGGTTNFDAMMKAKEPLWGMLVSPVIMAAGVIVGGGLRKNKD